MNGLPPLVTIFPGIDRIGHDCRIHETVSVGRRHISPDQGASIVIGNNVSIFNNVRFVVCCQSECQFAKISIGNNVSINVGSYISGEGGLSIGNDVLIGPGVKVTSAGHAIDGCHDLIALNPITYGLVVIEDGAWLGAGSVVLPGRKIGKGAVVGAGAVVTEDIPPFAVAVGNPARVVRYRSRVYESDANLSKE
ncbi:acyltransferase [Polynucleobacter paneuropaeus]|nr:acyltransferase [Polynucleobacter paneuropaeus]